MSCPWLAVAVMSGAVFGALSALGLAGCAASSPAPQSSAGGDFDSHAFSAADANHDGKLSRGETGEYLVYLAFDAYDKNHDGRMTAAEWIAGNRGGLAAFQERDRNRDGVVTLQEAVEYGRRGAGGVTLMRAADKNRDGQLDPAELKAYFSHHAAPLD